MRAKVSVIIPFFDNINLLKKAVSSVLNQNFNNLEIIIINDNPLNRNIKKNINFKKKNILILKNKKNKGAGYSRNKGILKAKGEYIAFLDSDDIWRKKKLSYQIRIMEKFGYAASHTSYNIKNINGKIVNVRHARTQDYKSLTRSCDVGLSTVIVRKKYLKDIKNPFPLLKTKEDYVCWLRLAKKNITFHGIDKILTDWLDRPESLSKSIIQKLSDAIKVYYLYEKKNLFNSILSTIVLSINYLKK